MGLTAVSSRHFYADAAWDEAAWIDVISIEYERLTDHYPFNQVFARLPRTEPARVLDVGCGTAIFPSYLSEVLTSDIRFTCDLLDISRVSLERAQAVLERLEHFSVVQTYQSAIEDIPRSVSPSQSAYDVVWAIHSFTTVDLQRMPDVYRHLIELLVPGGYFFVYQLTSQSTYQHLHESYRQQHPQVERYMEYEDSAQILDSLGVQYEVLPLQFDHRVPHDQPELLQNYLRKCVLDESLDALDFFSDALPFYRHEGGFRFPQTVNLLTISKR
jgi:SAM-dependent methyltransferase